MIAIAGSGAFGTALAIALARERPVILWTRDPDAAQAMQATRDNARRLPGHRLPDTVRVTADFDTIPADIPVLLAVPMQALRDTCASLGSGLHHRALVACCKGMDLTTGTGPSAILAQVTGAMPAVLTGPSFATDIARGLPTALTLACAEAETAQRLQLRLTTPVLRIYRSSDVTGAELGGALKNVVAIAAGAVIGAGLGDSARAALMTRGFAEMTRLALALGARADTLAGLSGFGDLVLTCTSPQSRNFRYGQSLGQGTPFDPRVTVEGAATARAALTRATAMGIEMPVTAAVVALLDGRASLGDAITMLLTRPLKEE